MTDTLTVAWDSQNARLRDGKMFGLPHASEPQSIVESNDAVGWVIDAKFRAEFYEVAFVGVSRGYSVEDISQVNRKLFISSQ